MAELNGTDTEEFLANLYAKAKEGKEKALSNQHASRNNLLANPSA